MQDDHGFPFGTQEKDKNIEISSLVIDSQYSLKSFPTSCTKSSLENYKCRSYARINLVPQTEFQSFVLHRRLKSLRDVVSSVGGFFTAAMLVSSFAFNILFKKISSMAKRRLYEATFSQKAATASLCKKKRGASSQERETPANRKQERDSYRAGLQIIEESLDAGNLIRELCLLKALLGFALDEQTRLAIPSDQLKLQMIKRRVPCEPVTSMTPLSSSFLKNDDLQITDEFCESDQIERSGFASNEGDSRDGDDPDRILSGREARTCARAPGGTVSRRRCGGRSAGGCARGGAGR